MTYAYVNTGPDAQGYQYADIEIVFVDDDGGIRVRSQNAVRYHKSGGSDLALAVVLDGLRADYSDPKIGGVTVTPVAAPTS